MLYIRPVRDCIIRFHTTRRFIAELLSDVPPEQADLIEPHSKQPLIPARETDNTP